MASDISIQSKYNDKLFLGRAGGGWGGKPNQQYLQPVKAMAAGLYSSSIGLLISAYSCKSKLLLIDIIH